MATALTHVCPECGATVEDGRDCPNEGQRCQHGRVGFCVDDLTPTERLDFEFLHRHAYEYAVRSGDRDQAERYAAWYAQDNYQRDLEDVRAHNFAYPEWAVRDAG